MKANPTLTLFPLTCARCGEPILPGQPYAQTSSVDVVDGRIAASPVRSYHTEKRLLPGRQAGGLGSRIRPLFPAPGGRGRRLSVPHGSAPRSGVAITDGALNAGTRSHIKEATRWS